MQIEIESNNSLWKTNSAVFAFRIVLTADVEIMKEVLSMHLILVFKIVVKWKEINLKILTRKKFVKSITFTTAFGIYYSVARVFSLNQNVSYFCKNVLNKYSVFSA